MKTRVKIASAVILAAAVFSGVSCARVLQEDAPMVGVDPTRQSSTSSASGTESTTMTVADEEELIKALEDDGHVTVVSPIEMGELLCDTLAEAEDADALTFLLLNHESVVAEKSSFTASTGDPFTDNIGRKVWTGVLVTPEQDEDEAFPRTVSMTWGDVCSTETFLLTVTTWNADETTSIVKTVPCFGSTTHTCLVEVTVEFDEPAGALVPPGGIPPVTTFSSNDADGGSTGGEGSDTVMSISSERRLQDEEMTQIDVMILYSNQSLLLFGGITSEQMESNIMESTARTNEAFVNSEVALFLNPVHIGLLPYEQTSTTTNDNVFEITDDEDVGNLRDLVGADLVQMVGDFNDGFCGRGWLHNGDPAYGFSVVGATCLADTTVAHEYGHNLGCFHNTEDSDFAVPFAHGLRYCDDPDPYRTIMSKTCGSPGVHYFSNPDVIFLNKPTGTATEDNARAIRENMVAVSNFRERVVTPPSPASTASPTAAPTAIPTTDSPTVSPTVSHTLFPTASPTADSPTGFPTASPTAAPTAIPTMDPPTESPTASPTAVHTNIPTTDSPTAVPTPTPTTDSPTGSPTASPTAVPTAIPTTDYPTGSPTIFPTVFSTDIPTTDSPTSSPTGTPTPAPATAIPTTASPTGSPTATPTGPPAMASPNTASPTASPTVSPIETPTTAPSTSAPPTTFTFEGCYRDEAGDRVLSGDFIRDDHTMTTEVCAAFCQGSPYFGTEFGEECFCGVGSDDPDRLGEAKCNFDCAGDASQTCGGRNAISVYTFDKPVTPPVFLGCYKDTRGNRIMDVSEYDSSMTIELCEEICSAYPFFGTQFGGECWCGGDDTDHTVHGESNSCNFRCAGDNAQRCGGRFAMSVYGHDPVVLPAQSLGCWRDTRGGRIMEFAASSTSMTNEVCARRCSSSYAFYGTQYGRECWCGDADTNHTVHGQSNSCNIECSGDAEELCGGNFAMSVWQYN